MKKKQLFAVLLAGSMTVGMAPAAAFAAEDTGAGAAAAAEAQVTDDNTDNTDNTDATDDSTTADAEAQKQAEADAQAAAQAQAEAEAQAAAEAEAQKQAEEQAAAEAEAQKQAEEQAAAEAEAQKKAEEQAAAEAAAKEATEKGTIVTTETELNDAIKAAAAVDTNVTTVAQAKPTRIVISGTIELTKSVTIPPNKSIALLGKDEEAAIKRADSYKGNLFEISANGALYMAKKDPTEEDPTTGTLTVDGSLSDGSAVTGSLIHIVEGASFSMTTGVTLKNNNSTATGAAIFNEGGKFILIGGTVTGNKGDNGAIYSTGIISVKKGEDATDAEPSVTGNVKSDGNTESNIVLAKGGNIQIISRDKDENGEPVKERITDQVKLGFSVESPEEGYAAIINGTNEDIFKAALKILASQYEGDKEKFTVNETTGQLDSAQEPVVAPVVSIKSTKWSSGTTATAVITSDKAGTYHYICTAKEDDSLTIDKCTESGEIEANKDTEIKLTGLSGKTAYLYVWVDDDGTVSERQTAKIVLTESDTKKAPVITRANSKWNSHTAATVTISSDKSGQYYYKWVTKGSKAPKFNTSKKGTKIAANTNTEIKLTKLKEETAIDFYVCVKDSNGKVSKTKKISLDETKRPANVKWVKLEWTSHVSAAVTIRSNFSGTCYYTWVERGDDGNSSIPKKNTIKNKLTVSKDRNFTIYLNDLNTDKAIDLYLYIKPSKGTESGTKKIKLDQTKRPAKGHTPVTPPVTESIVKGLSTDMEFYPNTFYPFEVIGAGTTNSDPGEGDVKWEPLYWSTSANPEDKDKHSTWKIGSTKGISKGSKFSLYVFFQKWVYTGGKWTETDTISSARYEFGSVPITITPSAGAGANGTNGSGSGEDGQTGSDPDATVTGAASETSSNGGNGTTSRNAVSTADNSPIGTMSALAVASILAGGYVIVRRRKKDI